MKLFIGLVLGVLVAGCSASLSTTVTSVKTGSREFILEEVEINGEKFTFITDSFHHGFALIPIKNKPIMAENQPNE